MELPVRLWKYNESIFHGLNKNKWNKILRMSAAQTITILH